MFVLALATWRLASLLIDEDGPSHIFERLRARAGVYDPGEVSGLATLFSCYWCLSVHAAAVLSFLPRRVSLVLAASAGAIAMEGVARRFLRQ